MQVVAFYSFLYMLPTGMKFQNRFVRKIQGCQSIVNESQNVKSLVVSMRSNCREWYESSFL